ALLRLALLLLAAAAAAHGRGLAGGFGFGALAHELFGGLLLEAEADALLVLADVGLREEEVLEDLLVDVAHHLLVEAAGFELEDDERLFLRVGAEPDVLAEV